MLLKGPWRGATPGSPSKINGASLLSRGLLFAFSGHQGLDLVTGTRPVATSVTERGSFNRRTWNFTGGSEGASDLNFGVLSRTDDLGEQPATWAFLATASATNTIALACQTTNNGDRGWEIGCLDGTHLGVSMCRTSTNVKKLVNNTITPNVPFTLVVTYDGSNSSGGINVYLNGVLCTIFSSQSSGSSSAPDVTDPLYLGRVRYSPGLAHNGNINVALIANRVWSSAEVKAFDSHPYQAFMGNASPIILSKGPPSSLIGSIAAVSALSGTPSGSGSLIGSIAAISTFVGGLGAIASTSGLIAASSGFAGTLTPPPSLGGTIGASSGFAATPSGRGALGGTIGSSATLNGTLVNSAIVNVNAVSSPCALTCDVIFSQAVNPSDALNTGNYSINNGITITGVNRITDSHYVLSTNRQVQGTVYTLTISNIRGM